MLVFCVVQEWFASRLHQMADSLAEASGNDGPDGKAPDPLPVVGFEYGKEEFVVFMDVHIIISSCVGHVYLRLMPEKHWCCWRSIKCQFC